LAPVVADDYWRGSRPVLLDDLFVESRRHCAGHVEHRTYDPVSQLYLAPVVIGDSGTVTSYPAIYLWNQPTTTVNTTPAWDAFILRRSPDLINAGL
jgi:hypothetical protein